MIEHTQRANTEKWIGTEIQVLIAGNWTTYKSRVVQYLQQVSAVRHRAPGAFHRHIAWVSLLGAVVFAETHRGPPGSGSTATSFGYLSVCYWPMLVVGVVRCRSIAWLHRFRPLVGSRQCVGS